MLRGLGVGRSQHVVMGHWGVRDQRCWTQPWAPCAAVRTKLPWRCDGLARSGSRRERSPKTALWATIRGTSSWQPVDRIVERTAYQSALPKHSRKRAESQGRRCFASPASSQRSRLSWACMRHVRGDRRRVGVADCITASSSSPAGRGCAVSARSGKRGASSEVRPSGSPWPLTWSLSLDWLKPEPPLKSNSLEALAWHVHCTCRGRRGVYSTALIHSG